MAADPHFSSVALLLHADGEDGSTALVDSSDAAIGFEALAGAQLDTDQKRFGSASMYFGASGAQFRAAALSDGFYFGAGDFTVEAWVRQTARTGAAQVAGLHRYGSNNRWIVYINSSGFPEFFNGRTPPINLVGAAAVPLNAWSHLAVCRSGATTRLFLNGEIVASGPDNYNYPAYDAPLTIGGDYTQNANGDFRGWIDELRITKGVARYTAAFTPPDAPFAGRQVSASAAAASPLGVASAMALQPPSARAAALSPLGTACALVVRVPQAITFAPSPLGAVSALGRRPVAGDAAAPSPLAACAALATHDFTAQLAESDSRYAMDLVTPEGAVRTPISSWQATIQSGSANYVQCVVPACAPFVDALNAATEFIIYRGGRLLDGRVIEYEMARAPASPQFDRGTTNYTCTLSGYANAWAGSGGGTRTLTGLRSISGGAGGTRVRSAIDWLLRPGDVAIAEGQSFTVEYLNYYVTGDGDAYADIGGR